MQSAGHFCSPTKWGILGRRSEVQKTNISRKPDEREAEVNQQRALLFWDKGIDPRSTLGETYLTGRGLLLPPKICMSVVRFNPRCPRGTGQGYSEVPALIVLMRNYLTRDAQAIQRIFINPVTHKKDRCKVSRSGAMMLGPSGGCAMMLTSWFDTFWDDLSFLPTVDVAEGSETALALHNQGYTPVWALGDAGHIRNFPVLFGVGKLVICADNDANETGIKAAEFSAARWNATTHQRASIWLRNSVGDDFADPVAADG